AGVLGLDGGDVLGVQADVVIDGEVPVAPVLERIEPVQEFGLVPVGWVVRVGGGEHLGTLDRHTAKELGEELLRQGSHLVHVGPSHSHTTNDLFGLDVGGTKNVDLASHDHDGRCSVVAGDVVGQRAE